MQFSLWTYFSRKIYSDELVQFHENIINAALCWNRHHHSTTRPSGQLKILNNVENSEEMYKENKKNKNIIKLKFLLVYVLWCALYLLFWICVKQKLYELRFFDTQIYIMWWWWFVLMKQAECGFFHIYNCIWQIRLANFLRE